MEYFFKKTLENGAVIEFNQTGTDYNIQGIMPEPIFANSYCKMYKTNDSLSNKNISTIVLYNDGIVNYYNLMWTDEPVRTIDNAPVDEGVDGKSYCFLTKKGLIQAFAPKNVTENKLLTIDRLFNDYNHCNNLNDLGECLKQDGYTICLIPSNPLRKWQETTLE